MEKFQSLSINLLTILLLFCAWNTVPVTCAICRLEETSCERCLQQDIACVWCTDKLYESRYRCLNHSDLLTGGCDPEHILTNQPRLEILNATPLKDHTSANENQAAVQIHPQHLRLQLVKGHTQTVEFQYRPARDHPLDLYVLMDLSWTMRDDRLTLLKLGSSLASTLQRLTPNYRLGFGSFADKPIMPMIRQEGWNPCPAWLEEQCVPTYSYRHHLTLTPDIDEFMESVNSSQITGNLDNLEGGLDALMQVLVCTEEIGWQQDARKVVLLVTDGFMHFAGDGLLAGIIRPNDGHCHLNAEQEYGEAALIYDYPSLEEIYRQLLSRKINVIFAVTEEVVDTYRAISEIMPDLTNVEILREDSSNIVNLIQKSYENFIQRTQFSDNAPDFIRLSYATDCGGQHARIIERNYCQNIELGHVVNFQLNVTLISQPSKELEMFHLLVSESGLSETLELELHFQAPCPCAEPPEPEDEIRRRHCHQQGFLHCGMCHCDEGWSGSYCSCPLSENTTNRLSSYGSINERLEDLCRQPLNSPTLVSSSASTSSSSSSSPNRLTASIRSPFICSNHGECDCGSCFCMEGYHGPYCECPDCDEERCDPLFADCDCGKCICKYGRSEEGYCRHCPDDGAAVEGCIAPNGEVCSALGKCDCGECKCVPETRGKYCEINSKTENKLCAFYEACVICLIEGRRGERCIEPKVTEVEHQNITTKGGLDKKNLEGEGDVKCSYRRQDTLETFEIDYLEHDLEGDAYEVRCLVRLENEFGIKCDHYFSYESSIRSRHLIHLKINVCEPLNYALVGTSVLVGTFLFGFLLIVLIRWAVRVKDAREYERFEQEQRRSMLQESPLYRDPITHYEVPNTINRNDSNPFL